MQSHVSHLSLRSNLKDSFKIWSDLLFWTLGAAISAQNVSRFLPIILFRESRPQRLPSSSSSSTLLSFPSLSCRASRVLYFLCVSMEAMSAVPAEAPFHVLAVDDSLIDRKLIEKLLKISSYQVTSFDSGTKALEFLGLNQEMDVNLTITDYCMPGMTGYDLLKNIKGSSSLKDIPVVVMSSENLPSRIHRCLEGGAEEFFVKPVQISDVNKLRPHLLKGRAKEKDQTQEDDESPLRQKTQTETLNTQESPLQLSPNKRKISSDICTPESRRFRLDGIALF